MKRFSQILNESVDIEEIEDYLLNINDILGKPTKKSMGSGNFIIYEFYWQLGVNINVYNSIPQMDKILLIFSLLKELKTSQARINEYDIEFKISGVILSVRITSKHSKVKSDEYEFFIEQSRRETLLSYSEIIRFFKDSGYSVINIVEEDDEYSEISSLKIYTNADIDTNNRFAQMLIDEFDENSDEIYNEFDVRSTNNYISIYPEHEKSYISLR